MKRACSFKNRIIAVQSIIVIFSLMLASCKKENTESGDAKGNVTFSFRNATETILKSATANSTDSVDAVVVSIKDQNNNYVYTNEVIKLLKIGDEFISSPLALKPGNYKLSDFMLIDKSDSVLFLTPKAGSKYAYLVDKPLDIDFTVSKDITTSLSPEVVSTQGQQPKDFGNTTFSFVKIETFDLLISVFTSNGSSTNLTDAYLTIMHSGNTIFKDSIHATTNDIKLRRLQGDYQLHVEKTGFENYMQTFTLDSLLLHSGSTNNPLIITLKKAITQGLVLWNKLGSPEEITHSVVGPNLHFYDPAVDGTTDCCDHVAVPAFSKGVYGNSISVGPSPNYFGLDRIHNVILSDASSVLDYKQGSIEFWYYQREDPLAFKYGVYRLWDGGYGFNFYFSFSAYDPSSGDDGLLNFSIRVNSNEIIALKYNPGENIRNNHNLNNRWIHLAITWNINGIDTSGNTMEMFVDGKVVASGKQNNWSKTLSGKVDICGGNDQYLADKFYMDNLKVWNYAKTDFSDRFNE